MVSCTIEEKIEREPEKGRSNQFHMKRIMLDLGKRLYKN